jgi:hypothetical protein
VVCEELGAGRVSPLKKLEKKKIKNVRMEGELDLDSLLDDFGPAAPVQTPSIHESKVGSKAIVSPAVEIIPQDKFLAELTSGMQILINEGVFNDPSEIEQLTKGLSQLSSKNVDIPATIAPSAEQDDGFQTKIKDTIDQLRRSDDGHSKFSQGSDSIFPNVEGGTITNHINFSGDMASMMKNFEGLMESGEFEGLFEGIFDQFVSRDLLYEPLKVFKLFYLTPRICPQSILPGLKTTEKTLCLKTLQDMCSSMLLSSRSFQFLIPRPKLNQIRKRVSV